MPKLLSIFQLKYILDTLPMFAFRCTSYANDLIKCKFLVLSIFQRQQLQLPASWHNLIVNIPIKILPLPHN